MKYLVPKVVGLVAPLMTMLACGAQGKAKPAEVDIEWPDSGVLDAPRAIPAVDAGAVAPAAVIEHDAMPSSEAPR